MRRLLEKARTLRTALAGAERRRLLKDSGENQLSVETLEGPLMPWRTGLRLGVASAALFGLASLTPLLETVELRLARHIELNARDLLGRTPKQDPRIKIFAWDDQTTAALLERGVVTATDLPLKTWATLFEALARQRPRAIFVDRVFENPIGRTDHADFVARLSKLATPVVIGSYVGPAASTTRKPIGRARPDFALTPELKAALWPGGWSGPDAHAYGPWPAIEPAFRHIGHIVNMTRLRMPLYLRLDEDTAVPHWALHVASRDMAGGRLRLDGHPVALTDEAHVAVDLIDRRDALARARSIKWLIDEIRAGREVAGVGPEDVVMILPHFYTGGTDFKDTPLGPTEGGLIQAAVLNSVLTGKYLRVGEGLWLLLLVLIAAAILAGLSLEPLVFWGFYATTVTAVIGLSLASFVYFDHAVPWPLPLAAFMATGSLAAIERQRLQHVRLLLARKDLEMGRQVQELLLPQARSGRAGDWTYHVVFKPYGPMSGDWFQLYVPPKPVDGICGVLAIGDVVGKGTSAALNTAVISAVWQTHVERWERGPIDAARLLEELNHTIFETFDGRQTTTISLAVLHETKVTLLAAGAPRWAHIDRAAEATNIRTPVHNPVGHRPGAKFRWQEHEVDSGCYLMAYTDGAMEMTSFPRFRTLVRAHGLREFSTDTANLERSLMEAGVSSALPDDMTILILQRPCRALAGADDATPAVATDAA